VSGPNRIGLLIVGIAAVFLGLTTQQGGYSYKTAPAAG